MSVGVSFRGQNYTIPEPGDANTQSLTDYLNALSTGAVPYPISADIDLGAAFGIKSIAFKTRAVNPAAAGLVRLATGDSIGWRNAGNTADVALAKDSGDALLFGGQNVTGNPMLGANTAAGQSIPASAHTIVVYGTVERDSDNAYNSTTGRYTVPAGKGGDYMIVGSLNWGAAPGAVLTAISIAKNGIVTKQAQRVNPASSDAMQVSAVLTLVAGDVIDIRAYQASAGAVVLSAAASNNYISIKRIPT
jgi:hypothetical protein